MTTAKKPNQKRLTSRLVLQILGVIVAVTYLLAAVSTLLGQLVPLKYSLVAFMLGAIGIFLLVRALFAKHTSRTKQGVLATMAVIVMVCCLGLISFNWSLLSFLRGIQPADYATETYSIIAEKDRNMTLKSAKTAGLIATDPYLSDVKTGLATKTAATPRDQQNTTELMTALESDQTDTAVLSSGYMDLIDGTYPKYESNIEILATFTIRVKNGVAAVPNVDTTKPFVVYISGIDTYGPIASVSRSDVNMLAVINPITHEILLVNTPRDYYVQLHGTTGVRDKLTHAGIYGIDMSRQTLEDLYDTKIDYYVRVNFTSLVKLVDTLGGITVSSDYAFKSFTRGSNQLNGTQALEFSRERYSFTEGDRQRGKNQQKVIEAIIAKISEPSNIVRYRSILSALENSLQTNVNESSISSLVSAQLDSMKRWDVESISVDGSSATASTYSMGNLPLYVMEPNQTSVDKAKAKIQSYLE